jgi:proline racemase
VGIWAKDFTKLIHIGRQIKYAVMDKVKIEHPFEPDLGFLYGTILIGNPLENSNHSRNVCIFAEGEVDRSPTGTGVSARAAIHYFKNEITIGQPITIESILGTSFDVEVVETTKFGEFDAVIPKVTGTASIIGQNNFYFDPSDPLRKGFIFR